MNVADSVREYISTVIIGGGQAGLTMAYHPGQAGERCLVLEASARVGDSWRHRWDSLRLFSFPKYASLPGWPMPQKSFPSHDEMADYLEDYVRHFRLPVRTSTWVQRLFPSGHGFLISTPTGELQADLVRCLHRRLPEARHSCLAGQMAPTIRQLHSSDYRNPSQLEGAVLVVGSGNSGAEIALEAAGPAIPPGCRVGTSTDSPPNRDQTSEARYPGGHVRVPPSAHASTHRGRKAHADLSGHATPLVRTKLGGPGGCRRHSHASYDRTDQGRPCTADGDVLNPQTIVWCTGYRDDFGWIEIPGAIDDAGHPVHERGVSPIPGLYYLGLEFQDSPSPRQRFKDWIRTRVT